MLGLGSFMTEFKQHKSVETETARQIEDALRKLDSMEKQLDSQQYLNAQIER